MTPDQYCQAKAAGSGSSFYYAFLFLPPERRRAITALYAFCREVDDAVDEPSDPEVARARLAWWSKEVAALYAGHPEHPVGQALLPAIAPFDLRRDLLEEIIAGMSMDLAYARYTSFDDLRLYCHRVAGVVGSLAARIFGHTDPATLDYAERLGLAFQLTNIIRDIGEDARRNRIYLPLEDLAAHDVPAADLLEARTSDRFRKLLAFQIDRARRCYEDAFARLPTADRRTQRPGIIMAGIYRTLLEEIARDPDQVLTHRTSLPPIRKLWIAWRTWLTA